jgi:hypothetical protein
LAETIKKLHLIVLKPLDGNHGRSLSINIEIGKMWFLVFYKEYSKRINRKNLLRIRLIEYWSLTTN